MKKWLTIFGLILTLIVFLFAIVIMFRIRKPSNSEYVEANLHDLQKFSNLRGDWWFKKQKAQLSNIDFTNKYDVLLTAIFNTETVWPTKLPKEFHPLEILEIGKDPGLGISDLHKEGITGKGVKVAIIDQPLLLEHIEYKTRIAQYFQDKGPAISIHGPAVASILVGKNCGVAPDASLYFWADTAEHDYIQMINALDQIVEYNQDKPIFEKIRVVSISMGDAPEFKNFVRWKKSILKAEKNGVIVLYCSSSIDGIGCPLYQDRDDPENYRFLYSAPGYRPKPGSILVPIDNRTTAGEAGQGNDHSYVFWAKGGASWEPPYLAGVIALGYQINPDIEPKDVFKYLIETGTPLMGGYIVNPKKFIQRIQGLK